MRGTDNLYASGVLETSRAVSCSDRFSAGSALETPQVTVIESVVCTSAAFIAAQEIIRTHIGIVSASSVLLAFDLLRPYPDDPHLVTFCPETSSDC